MRLFVVVVLVLSLHDYVFAIWDKEIVCPSLCTCRLEHTTETAIHRFMQKDNEKSKQPMPEAIILESNDVYYDDDEFSFDESSFVRSATCIVQTETRTEDLINELPREVQSITLIQASDSGNKSIRFSDFDKFPELKILELQSAQRLNKDANASHFVCEVDLSLRQLEYLNLERVLLRNSKNRRQLLELEASEDVVTFEYVQKSEGDSQPLTFVRRGTNDKILPYKVYVENQKNHEYPLFTGFSSLLLLRIYECQLNSIHWEMFEDLGNLNSLILENNKLRYIPDFAFYGTPNLKSLSLAWNNLLNIQITDLAGLLELEYLDLSHNNFSQLSELSLPPFPRLKLANFANNPITVVFPNTFEVMNTTDSLILGGLDEPLSLLTNSFLGLHLLKTLTLLHLNIPLLRREVLIGMPSLKTLVMTGNIPEIQYDAFVDVYSLESLILSRCNITVLSMDSFIGLNNLRILDLSRNNLEYVPPGTFDDLKSLREIYLNNNKFKNLPKDIFTYTHARMIRINENPWHCSCDMSDWKPLLINRIKQKSIKPCDYRNDKGVGCTVENSIFYKYVYENKVSPKCATPVRYENWNVFHVMRKQFKCPEFKPKLKKRLQIRNEQRRKNMAEKANVTTPQTETSTATAPTETTTENVPESLVKLPENVYKQQKLEKLKRKQALHTKLQDKLKKTIDATEIMSNSTETNEENDLSKIQVTVNSSENISVVASEENNLLLVPAEMRMAPPKKVHKVRKHRKNKKVINKV